MKKILTSVVSLCLLVTSLTGWKCNPAQSITLAQAGYQTHVYALAAVKTAKAFNTYQPTSLQNPTYANLLKKIESLDDVAERLFLEIDSTPEIGPANKLELLTKADAYAALVDGVIADHLFPVLPDSLRNTILIARSLASGIKLAISTIQTTQLTAKVTVDATEANGKAAQAAKSARSKSATSDLIQAVSQIVADTAADVLAAKGLEIQQVRELRKAKRVAVRDLITAERARLGL